MLKFNAGTNQPISTVFCGVVDQQGCHYQHHGIGCHAPQQRTIEDWLSLIQINYISII